MSKEAFKKAFDNRSAQDRVVDATRKRGYREPWTDEQFLARNILKMQEELAELTANVHSLTDDNKIAVAIFRAAIECKQSFDDIKHWENFSPSVSVGEISSLRKEAADMQVVLFNIADAIAQITGEPFDVVQAAVEKARDDIKRGVR